MFRRIECPQEELPPSVEIHVEGQPVQARDGESVATALLNAGVTSFRRTAVSEQPRAPLCLMGVCFECLVEIDGVQNVQSCMTTVRRGMQVRLQRGAGRVGSEP